MLKLEKYSHVAFDLILICKKLNINFDSTYNKLKQLCDEQGYVMIETKPLDFYCIVKPIITQIISCHFKHIEFFKDNINEINKEYNTFIIKINPINFQQHNEFHRDLYNELKMFK